MVGYPSGTRRIRRGQEVYIGPVPEIRRIMDNIKRFEIGKDALDLKVMHQTHDKIVMGESHDNLLLEL